MQSLSLVNLAVELKKDPKRCVDIKKEHCVDDMLASKVFDATEGAKKTVVSITASAAVVSIVIGDSDNIAGAAHRGDENTSITESTTVNFSNQFLASVSETIISSLRFLDFQNS